MTLALSEQTEMVEPADPFRLDGISPLPSLFTAGDIEIDAVATAERRVAQVDAEPDRREARIEARIALADLWLARSSLSPALEAIREAQALSPDDPQILERLGPLLSRAGAHEEAGQVFAALARATGRTESWLAAGRALVRAQAFGALDALLEEVVQRFPDDLGVAKFVVEVARLRPDSASLVARLTAAWRLAVRYGDAAYAAQCAIDAWLESRGQYGSDLVAESLLACGDARSALSFALVAAIRAGSGSAVSGVLTTARRAARALGASAAEAAIVCATAVITAGPDARARTRDYFAERGSVVDLAARLRADARRTHEPSEALTAWKRVAAIEASEHPVRAVFALAEALAVDPDDVRAREQLLGFAKDPITVSAAHDALFWATRPELGFLAARCSLLALLGDLSHAVGDPASARLAYRRAVDAGADEVLAALRAVSADAKTLFARVDAAMSALDHAPRDRRSGAVDALLEAAQKAPGAVRDLGQAARVFGPLVASDARVSDLWLRVVRRLGDTQALCAVLRRISTRSIDPTARASATIDLAELLDQMEPGSLEAVEVLEQLLDEPPPSLAAVATLSAFAEYGDAPASARSALAAMARVAVDPVAHGVLVSLAGQQGSTDPSLSLEALTLAFEEAQAPGGRTESLLALTRVLGETPTMLARRTRALLAEQSAVSTDVNAARSFAESVPSSSEATIVWFSAAKATGDPERLADAAVAVVHSLATVEQAASVSCEAIAQLLSGGHLAAAARVGRVSALTLGLTDRALREAVLACAEKQSDLEVMIELLEAVAAGMVHSPDQALGIVRRLVQIHHARGDTAGETYALRQLLKLAPGDSEALARLAVLVPAIGERYALVRVLAAQLAAKTDASARRAAYLSLAAAQASSHDRGGALATLDRYVEEWNTAEARGEVARSLLALGEHRAAVERLERWAEGESDPSAASRMLGAAARALRDAGGDPARVLGLVRAGLARQSESPELLLFAEEVATRAQSVRSMLDIYADLDAAAAGEHGRRALAYRRAAFLEAVGEQHEALRAFLAVFEQNPAGGVLVSSIERLAAATGHLEVLATVDPFRKVHDSESGESSPDRSDNGTDTWATLALSEPLGGESNDVEAEASVLTQRLRSMSAGFDRLGVLLRVAELLQGPLGRPEEARTLLGDEVKNDPDNLELLRALHGVVEQLGDWVLATELLRRCILHTKDRAEVRALRLHRAAVLEQRLEDMGSACEELEAILVDEPAHRAALRYLADLNMRRGHFRAAGECFTRVAAMATERVERSEVFAMAGEAFARAGDDGAAEVQFRRGLENHPGSAHALKGLTEAAARRNDWAGLERTLVTLAETTKVDGERGTLCVAAARAALEAGAIYRAKGHLDAGRKLAPASKVAEIDAALQAARDNDRPISRGQVETWSSSAHSATEMLMPPGARDSGKAVNSEQIPQAVGRVTQAKNMGDAALRQAAERGEDEALREMAHRLARTDQGRPEAIRIERQRFCTDPTRLDALESLVGLLGALGRSEQARAVRTVLEVLSGRDATAAPPPLFAIPEPPPDGAARMTLPSELSAVGEVGALLWDALSNGYRRELSSYGVSGADRVASHSPTELARWYSGAVQVLQVQRTALFVRHTVPGGAMAARTHPPAVVLGAALAQDNPASGFVLGQALEATRPCFILACTLDPPERAALVQAVSGGFGPQGVMAGAPAGVARLAHELYLGLVPRAQRRLQDLLAVLERARTPFSEECWLHTAQLARDRAGLLVSGDFGVAARMVVARHRGGGEPDVRGALAELEPLKDLCRFAVSEQYLLLRWQDGRTYRSRW